MEATPTTGTHAVDAAQLTAVVRQALNSPAATVTDWRQEQIRGGVGRGTEVHRFSGQAQEGGQTVPWSLILKILHPVPDEENDPSHWFSWRREAEAYRSGWLDELPGNVRAPRCYGVEERPDGSYWLWLEEVQDDIGDRWPLEHYGVVARHLGQFNGAYLTGEPMPDYPWLSRDGIRRHVESSAPAIEQMRQFRDHPLVRRYLANGVGERLFQAWDERRRWLMLLDGLPQTICQHDAFRRNLFAQRQADGSFATALIDWSYAGQGAIGAEVVPLVMGTVAFLEVDLAHARELEQAVLEGYTEGLRDAGWAGDPRLVEMGYLVASNRYGLGSVGEILPFMIEDPPPVDIKAVYGCSVEELLDYWNAVWRTLDTTPRGRELAQTLGL